MESLPVETSMNILEYIDDIIDIAHCMRVCRQWNSVLGVLNTRHTKKFIAGEYKQYYSVFTTKQWALGFANITNENKVAVPLGRYTAVSRLLFEKNIVDVIRHIRAQSLHDIALVLSAAWGINADNLYVLGGELCIVCNDVRIYMPVIGSLEFSSTALHINVPGGIARRSQIRDLISRLGICMIIDEFVTATVFVLRDLYGSVSNYAGAGQNYQWWKQVPNCRSAPICINASRWQH